MTSRPPGTNQRAALAITRPSVPGETKMSTLPAMTTMSNVRPRSRSGSVRSPSTQGRSGAFAARRVEHGRVDVDAHDHVAAPAELHGHATGATARIEHRARAVRVDQRRLTVHVDAGSGQLVETTVVGGAARDVTLLPWAGHAGYGVVEVPPGSVCVVAPAGRLNRLADGVDEYFVSSK